MNIKHASIIPLIGGETIGSMRAFGTPPEYLMSYKAFAKNDSHLVNYFKNEVPYYVLDDGMKPDKKVDVIGSVCPCAGLSLLSQGYGDNNPNNKWLLETTKYVLSEIKPKVLWGENAPQLIYKIGTNIRRQMYETARENGYSMSIYKTWSLLHGVPQIRDRTFYFFWQGDKTPLLNYFNRPYQKIEDLITNVKTTNLMEPINPKTPTDDPYYQFALQVVHGGVSHREFFDVAQSEREINVAMYIQKMGYNYKDVADWMNNRNLDKEVAKCMYKYNKLNDGKNVMQRGLTVPKGYIGAFISHYPVNLTHPYEDRYITYREALSIMGLPEDFELLNHRKTVNHICQNVPVQTATDMATEILEYLKGNREMLDSTYVFQFNQTQTHKIMDEKQSTLENFLV
jgi:site-specific DNA-cytosine methylase